MNGISCFCRFSFQCCFCAVNGLPERSAKVAARASSSLRLRVSRVRLRADEVREGRFLTFAFPRKESKNIEVLYSFFFSSLSPVLFTSSLLSSHLFCFCSFLCSSLPLLLFSSLLFCCVIVTSSSLRRRSASRRFRISSSAIRRSRSAFAI